MACWKRGFPAGPDLNGLRPSAVNRSDFCAKEVAVQRSSSGQTTGTAQIKGPSQAQTTIRIAPEPSVFQKRLEHLLTPLKPSQRLAVNSDGDLLRPGQERQATFQRSENGTLWVRDGGLSRNGTFVWNVDGLRQATEGALIVVAGTRIGIAGHQITVRDKLDVISSADIDIARCEERIFNMAVGARLTIGRSFESDIILPGEEVSRVHCTIERLADVIVNRRHQSRYRLSDGPRSSLGTEIEVGGEWRRIEGWRKLLAGMRVRFAADDSRIFSVTREMAGDPAAEEGSTPGEHSKEKQLALFARDARWDCDSLNVAPSQAHVLGIHLSAGVELLRGADIDGAIRHFSDEKIMRLCGFMVRGRSGFRLIQINERAVLETLEALAQRQWFSDARTVTPVHALMPKDFAIESVSVSQRALIEVFRREYALICAAQWCYAYQQALGKFISRKGIFMGGPSAAENDAAQFLREQQILLADDLLLSRNDNRKVLARLEGVQTAEQQSRIADQLTLLYPGEEILLGRGELSGISLQPPLPADCCRSHPQMAAVLDEREIQEHIRQAYTQISRNHCTIKKLSNGNYFVIDGSTYGRSSNGVYFQDPFGIWRRMHGQVILTPASKLRLGYFFELVLP